MDCEGINAAYGDVSQYGRAIENVRRTADLPIMLDIKCPELRFGVRRKNTVKRGNIVRIDFRKRLVRNEDTVLFTAAFRTATMHSSNLIEIHQIGEIADSISGN